MKPDLNGDGKVDALDLSIVAKDTKEQTGAGDVNGDGVTNSIDVAGLAADWQKKAFALWQRPQGQNPVRIGVDAYHPNGIKNAIFWREGEPWRLTVTPAGTVNHVKYEVSSSGVNTGGTSSNCTEYDLPAINPDTGKPGLYMELWVGKAAANLGAEVNPISGQPMELPVLNLNLNYWPE